MTGSQTVILNIGIGLIPTDPQWLYMCHKHIMLFKSWHLKVSFFFKGFFFVCMFCMLALMQEERFWETFCFSWDLLMLNMYYKHTW